MSKLSYDDIHIYYANKCSICKGKKRVFYDEVWTVCGCQHIATARWRLEQIQVYPDNLKYKDWSDFTGLIKDKSTTVGRLNPASALEAKNKAMKYCFGSDDPNAVKDRRNTLKVQDHISDGQNVIIAGGRGSGRSLLACLILKEVIYATSYFNLRLDYKWIKANSLISAARWDGERPINHDFLDDIQAQHFLVVDGIDLPQGGHNNPPDMVALNLMFYYRKLYQHPTIIVCSDTFWAAVTEQKYEQGLIKRWGEEFFELINDPGNLVIELIKEEG